MRAERARAGLVNQKSRHTEKRGDRAFIGIEMIFKENFIAGREIGVFVIGVDPERGSLGDGGRQPGLFFAVHSIATDSQGNIFTTETYEGSRIQKFRFTGMGARPSTRDMGAAWPQARRSGGFGWSFGN